MNNHGFYRYGPDCGSSVRKRNLYDLTDGLTRSKLVFSLSVMDIAQRYRNTYLGPLWMTISLSLFLSILGYVGGALFNIGLDEYLPYLCLGVLLWSYISGVISESGQLFVVAPVTTVVYDVPLSVFVYSFLVRHTILFFHNVLIYIAIAIYFKINFLPSLHWVLVGLFILLVFCLGMVMFLSIVCIKLRDIPQIVSNLLQVGFFITPIMWKAELLEQRGKEVILDFNPFYYLIEIVRAPLMGMPVKPSIYGYAIVLALLSISLGVYAFSRYKHRVMFYR